MSDIIELAVVPKESALQVFSADKGLEPFLAKIRAEIDKFEPDASTKKGRDAIASIAHKVAKAKVALDNVGKELVADLKEMPKRVDVERKRMRDLLDVWKDEVRAPLTAWEQAEEARVAQLRLDLERLRDLAACLDGLDSSSLRERLIKATDVRIGTHWQEYEPEAARAKDDSVTTLSKALVSREQYESDQLELAHRRAEDAERERAEREATIAREAEDRARRAAEAQAQAERDAATRREAEARAAAERRELELQLQAERAQAAAAKADRDRVEAQQRAEHERVEAEQRHVQAVERAKQAGIQRQIDEAARIERETKAREADKAHKTKVNRAALDAFVAGGMTEACAKQAVTMIAKGQIPAIRISY